MYRVEDNQSPDAIQAWMSRFQENGFEIVEVSSVSVNNTRTLKQKNAYIANICGKISHYSTTQIYREEIMPYVQKLQNRFGIFKCLYSPLCNFHTGCVGQITLFRGAKCSNQIQEAIVEAFAQEYIHNVKVHNIMASARTGIPIAKQNKMIGTQLCKFFDCEMHSSLDGDDCMFIHSFFLQKWSKTTEQTFHLHEISTVRVNICRTGVINMFLSIRGGVNLHDEAEKLYMPFFEQICKQVCDVT